jgi:2-amino-4-hydroxy-6-hydroxymethyldihydropteridine diphosphokinase
VGIQATHDAYIALGSNLGDREDYLHTALRAIHGYRGLRLTGLSGIYQTAPVGYTDQDSFLNMVCRISLSLGPFELLEALQEIENGLARKRTIRWGPRTIDLDLLLYDREIISTPSLTVPHPRMFERAFVLVPLRDVYPDSPIQGVSLGALIEASPDREGITLYRAAEDIHAMPAKPPARTGPCW